MRKTDLRKLSSEQLTDLRKRAVAAVQGGESPKSVARVLGAGVSTVFGWLARYRAGGWDALRARRRGGRPRKLDGAKLKWIYDAVAMNDPRQYKFPFALWTSKMVGKLIEGQFGIRLSKASVCRLLRQLGLSPQKPLWRAYQQDPARVERWKREEYPAIRKQARLEGATIYFADEAGVRSDFHAGTTWAKRGSTPVVKTTGSRFGLNIISAVSPRGEMRFMTVSGTVNAAVFISFLKRLLHNADRPIFLIVDGHPVHRSKAVKRFVESAAGRLRLFQLPPYSPELNPDEQVWNDLKNNAIGRQPSTSLSQLKAAIISHLHRLRCQMARIRSFFRTPDTRYAAEAI